MKSRKLIRATLFCLLILSVSALYIFISSPNSSASNGGAQTDASETAVNPLASQTLERLRNTSGQQLTAHASRRTGVYDSVRVSGGSTAVLTAASPLQSPETRARAFLADFGGLVGMTSVERQLANNPAAPATADGSALQLSRTSTDRLGMTHVKFDQTYKGMKVLGGQLIVHMNASGIKGINGNFVPGINVGKTPKITAARANTTALASLRKSPSDASLRVMRTELGVYHIGLLEGYKGRSVLAYAVTVASANGDTVQVWVNAKTGNVINKISLTPHALYRLVFAGSYSGNDADAIHEENNPLKPAPPIGTTESGDLFHFAGHTYNLFMSGFGRENFDGNSSTRMRSVLLTPDPVNDPTRCPNAFWNGQTTNYCPEVTSDDVVSHEWGHAYTQYTHNLIYSYQSGALNESYSDIFGETMDLLNGHDQPDAVPNNDNTQPTQYTVSNGQYAISGGGVRWRIGEEVQGLNQPAALGILRDMWDPMAFGDPDKVSSPNYHCTADDGGGVHTNSGVPNLAYALIVDGTTNKPGGQFNGQTITGIGFVKALAIYYHAMDVYQVSSTNFEEHEQALRMSCSDLKGLPLNNLSTAVPMAGVAIGQVISDSDCQQLAKALVAVEMSRDVTAQCNFQKLLDPETPEECNGSSTIFTEDWESGMDGWTLNNEGVTEDWPGTNWTTKSDLPANLDGGAHAGTAAFAINPQIGEPNGGTCTPGGDVSGHFWMDSPTITIPAGASDLKLAFEHFVQTEGGFDGGNVKISINDGAFTLVPQNQYVFNAPPTPLDAAPTNTNPMAGELAWHGANGGELSGSWGTTIINLANLTEPGDTIKVRFDFGQDGCNGNLGWLVDTVRLYSCPFLEAPTLSLGADYGNPDKDGKYTLNWTQPTGSTGPSVVQESTSCGPVFTDDAQETLVAGENTKWVGSEQWTSQPNPNGGSTAYYIPDGVLQDDSLAMKNAITIPAGASASLTFTTRQGLEDGFDFGHVDVSTDGGTNFAEVTSYTGPEGALLPTDVFDGTRTVDLSQFAGQSIKVRFRVTSDPFNVGQQAGWYVDDIAITASAFQTVASGIAGNSHTFVGKPDGNFCYRVSTGYPVGNDVVQSPFSNVENVTVSNLVCLTNVAASANGGSATASSIYSVRDYSTASAIDGERTGINWEHNGGWNDGTRGAYDDWLQVDFQGSKRVRQINVITLQNNFHSPTEPTPLMSCDVYGLLDYEVQYLNSEGDWVTVPGGNITGNNLVLRTIILNPLEEITTTKIRVLVHDARAHFSRIVEVEAIGCDAQP